MIELSSVVGAESTGGAKGIEGMRDRRIQEGFTGCLCDGG